MTNYKRIKPFMCALAIAVGTSAYAADNGIERSIDLRAPIIVAPRPQQCTEGRAWTCTVQCGSASPVAPDRDGQAVELCAVFACGCQDIAPMNPMARPGSVGTAFVIFGVERILRLPPSD